MCGEAQKEEWNCFHFSFSPCKQCRETPHQFSNHNKGFINYVFTYYIRHNKNFINYVFCRKRAIRNCWDQARLSSLVNTQVATVVKEVTEVSNCSETEHCQKQNFEKGNQLQNKFQTKLINVTKNVTTMLFATTKIMQKNNKTKMCNFFSSINPR